MKMLAFALLPLLATAIAVAHSGEEEHREINHLLEGGLSSVSFRLFSQKDSSRCLISASESERKVLQWSTDCGKENSIFKYQDGGGYAEFVHGSGDYVTFILKTHLPKKSSVPMIAENMFAATTLTQEEWINGMTADPILQEDGTYIIADYDEEEPTDPKMCVGSGSLSGSSNLKSVELVPAAGNTCAKLVLKKI